MSYQSSNIEMEALAATILGGENLPYGRFGLYSATEWDAAAEYAVDTVDWSELEYMCEDEEAHDRGVTYPADHFWRDSIHADRSGFGEAA